ncbi:MAG: transposase [Planctomycetota bacterium]|nr:transposase [Planctomycetota bacterium]
MPRAPRASVGGIVYHVLNRANGGATIFKGAGDYQAFEQALSEARDRLDMRILAYCVMPNHWHMVLWPRQDGDLSDFAGWLTTTHIRRWHAFRKSDGTGHLYQGRFKSFPVQEDAHFLTVCRYVERNPLRAGLVTRAEDWKWSSLWLRLRGDSKAKALLGDWPLPLPPNWVAWVNEPLTQEELDAVRECAARGTPYGECEWTVHTAAKLGLESTLRPRGRPKERR